MSNIQNLTIDQGSSRTYTFTLTTGVSTPLDLTSYDARLQVRRSYGDTSVLINCTLSNLKLASGGSNGIITLSLSPTDTSSIRFANKEDDTLECVYDLEIVSPTSKVYKPAKGSLTISREITR